MFPPAPLAWFVLGIVQVEVAVYLFASRASEDEGLSRWLTSGAVVLGSFVFLQAWVLPALTGGLRSMSLFTFLMAAMVIVLVFFHHMPPQPALFCATAGYALQNLSSCLDRIVGQVLISAGVVDTSVFAVPVVVAVITYSACHALLIRRIQGSSMLAISNSWWMVLLFVMVEAIVIGFDQVIGQIETFDVPVTIQLLLRTVHALVCVFVLFSEYQILYASQTDFERRCAESLLAERARQYEMSRQNIEAINIKCHDIKHQIRSLSSGSSMASPGALAELADEVAVYDSVVRTGNDAVDTILTEKSLLCQQRGVTLTCIVDGRALGQMVDADIYTLFGNLLDNAIEAAQQIPSEGRRSVSLTVKRRRGMVYIHEENLVATAPTFVGGVPQTTKQDRANHGFGVRSMRLLVEKYDGLMSMGMEGDTFVVDIALPLGAK